MYTSDIEQRVAASAATVSFKDFLSTITEDSRDGVEYVRATWLGHIGRTLRRVRMESGLSQQDVAERMETSQPAVARMELDTQGRVTVRRMLDFLLACSKAPLYLATVSVEEINQFTIESPLTEWSSEALATWREQRLRRVEAVARLPGVGASASLSNEKIIEQRDRLLDIVASDRRRAVDAHFSYAHGTKGAGLEIASMGSRRSDVVPAYSAARASFDHEAEIDRPLSDDWNHHGDWKAEAA